jgi:hypothetical protein
MKKLILIIGLGIFFTSCEDSLTDIAADKINEAMYETAKKLEGSWELEKVQYVYKENINDVWTTLTDTLYDDAAGLLNINYLEMEKVNGNFNMTFNQDSAAKIFEGNTLDLGVLKALSIKYEGANPLFRDFAFTDFIVNKASSTKLELNKKSDGLNMFKEDWYLEFKKIN